MPPLPTTRPELLAPAGDWDALRAAVANGADAVYFGLPRYSARQRATNFRLEELAEVIAYLHGHNVRGYVAFNTLVFPDELPQAVEYTEAIAAAGADAVIVQDLGLSRLIRSVVPTMPLHASTQMSLTEPRGIEIARELGIERVILARELSLHEIGRIREATTMPLEVFVHGALCMSYSGQCLASEALWGRSANRGLCGQACRLPYELLVGGRPRNLGGKTFLLSTKDLAAYDRVADLVRLGVTGLKIEGRLKSAPYVAVTTQIYRAAIDAAVAGRPFALLDRQRLELAQSFSRGFSHGFLDGADHPGLVEGLSPKSRGVEIGVVSAITPRGIVIALTSTSVAQPPAAVRNLRQSPGGAQAGHKPEKVSKSAAPRAAETVKPGDGLAFEGMSAGQPDQGGRVFFVKPLPRSSRLRPASAAPASSGALASGADSSGAAASAAAISADDFFAAAAYGKSMPVRRIPDKAPPGKDKPGKDAPIVRQATGEMLEIRFAEGAVDPAAIRVGAKVWKTDDPEVRRAIEVSYARDEVVRRVPLAVRFRATIGQPLLVHAEDDAGNSAEATWDQPLEKAEKRPLTEDLVREQFGRLGDTPFELGRVDLVGSAEDKPADSVMVPKSVLNDLRRRLVESLVAAREARTRREVVGGDVLADLRREIAALPSLRRDGAPTLHVLVRTLEQLDAALTWTAADGLTRPASIYADFTDARQYAEAVARARRAAMPIALATRRIAKPDEEEAMEALAAAGPDAVLVRHLAAVSYFRERSPQLGLVADFSLNIANEITAATLLRRGVGRLTASLDLSAGRLGTLLAYASPAWFEAIIHLHVPMMHMEHCLPAAHLATSAPGVSGTQRNTVIPSERGEPTPPAEAGYVARAGGSRNHAVRATATSSSACGRACDGHVFSLRDRIGAEHPLVMDARCRSTLFSSHVQSALPSLGELARLGLRHFRLEFLGESPATVRETIDLYARVIAGRLDEEEARQQLTAMTPGGVRRGTWDFE
jgi:putative protease